ncbi:unnamed protein product [Rotaria magnacalcarata]
MSVELISESIATDHGRVSSVKYTVIDSHTGAPNDIVCVTREAYDQLAASAGRKTLKFDDFIKVLRPFMMGRLAADDIPEAFVILDSDRSGKIALKELAAFIPIIIPGGTEAMLMQHMKKIDGNYDEQLDSTEFTNFIMRGIGRDIVLQRH